MGILRPARRWLLGGLLLAGAALAASAFAGGATESEPNNDLATADAAFPASQITGNCGYGDDDFVAFYSAASRLVHIDYSFSDGISLDFFDPAGQLLRDTSAFYSGEMGFIALPSGNYSLEMSDCYGHTNWALTFSDAGPWIQREGEADMEPNDVVGQESSFSPGAGRGHLDPMFDPLDRWFIPVASPSVLRVVFVSANNSSAWVTSPNASAFSLPDGAKGIIVAEAAPPGVNIAVYAGQWTDSYSLAVTTAATGEPFFAGPDEVEPNGQQGGATPFEAKEQVVLRGYSHGTLDREDYYKAQSARAALLTVDIQADYGCYYYYACPRFSLELEGGAILQPYTSGECCFGFNGSGRFLLEAGAEYFFRVSTTDTSGGYTLSLSFRFAQVAADSLVSVESAAQQGLIQLFASRTGGGFGARADLSEAASGSTYGPTLRINVLNLEPVPLRVEIPAGTKWRPDFGEPRELFTTRTASLSLPAGGSSDTVIFAVASAAGAANQGFVFQFFLNGSAEGSLLAVLDATATGEFTPRAEATAVWALTNNWDRAPLHQQGASDAVIDEANRIFAKAKVPSPISSLSDAQVISIFGVSSLGAAATLAGAYFVARRGRRKEEKTRRSEPPASK